MYMKFNLINRFVTIIVLVVLVMSCEENTYSDIIEENNMIILSWSKNYDEQTIDEAVIGLRWALSYVGATLPYQDDGLTIENNTIVIDSKKIGLPLFAEEKLERLHQALIASEEFQVNHSIDLGRYVTLLLGSSDHYYQLTGVPYLLSDILSNYTLKPDKGYVNNSGVSFEHRIIAFSEQEGFNQLFFCEEIDPETGNTLEFETVELMPNGQIRFGIFDKNGIRQNGTDPTHSIAGKPAKCMWCHESGIQPLFSQQQDVSGYIPYLEFNDILWGYKNEHRTLQYNLQDGVNYQETQQHTLTELLYISFMEPSAKRLSLEWKIPVSEVESILSGLSTHIHEEFEFLGDLYFRTEVESFAPYHGLPVSGSVRESSGIEVNYMN